MRLFRVMILAAVVMAAQLSSGEDEPSGRETADVDQLLSSLQKSFSSIQTVQARFTQEKRLKVFARTITLQGRLTLANPGRLAWRIDSPIKYELVLDGSYAAQWDEETNKIRKDKVAGDPIFEEVLGQIAKWFSGDFISLLSDYSLTIPSRDPLRLEFVPREGSLSGKAIRRVTVSIRPDHAYVDGLAIEDISGDLTSIRFHETVLNAPVDPAEWKVGQGGR